MYRLYGAPGRASAAPEAVLEELGVPYEYVHVGAEERQSAEYKRLNPLGQVPALADGDHVLLESAAICIYLCDHHPAGGLAPAIDSPERGRFYQWLFFLSNTLQPAYMLYFYPERYYSDAAGAPRLKQDAEPRIARLWGELDAALEPGPYLLGEHYSACDIYMYMLSTWHRESIVPLASFPRLARNLELVARKPGVARMMLRNAGH
jgi:glutathione S-transferase